jgi:peptide/nickel transport system substrate-binding protein
VLRTMQIVAASLIFGLVASVALAQYSQSPFLDGKDLPAVADRLPAQPYVYTPLIEVGVFGGRFNVFSTANHPWNEVTEEPARGPFLNIMLPDGTVEPDLLLTYNLSADNSVATYGLREGHKWSNGDPLTAEDFRFKFEDMKDQGWMVHGRDGGIHSTFTVIDDLTIELNYNEPRPRALLDTVHWRGGEWTMFHPSTWLKQYHGDFDGTDAAAIEEGFADWQESFAWHTSINPLNDTNKPTSQPWYPVEFSTTARLYERNPYFHQVDTAGQQLPYVDSVLSQIVDGETYNLKIISGEADLAWANTSMENYTLYQENKVAGDYKIGLIPSFTTGDVVFFPNYSHNNLRWRALFAEYDFRRALSVAIDREEINEIVYLGMSKALQFTVTEFSPIYKERWGNHAVKFDPAEANALLDGLGLTERNGSGIRLDADGNALVFSVITGQEINTSQTTVNELVKEYWADIGIGFEARSRPLAELWNNMDFDFVSDSEQNGEMYTTILRGGLIGFRNAPWEWYRRARKDIANGVKTLDDFEGGVLPGIEPPADLDAMFDIRDDLNRTVFGGQEYSFLADAYFGQLSDGLYSIGTVGQVPIIFLSRSNIGNIIDTLPPWLEGAMDLNHFTHQYFYKPE